MGQQAYAVFTEHADVQPVYCSGVASVDVDGGNVHFAFYQERTAGDGSKERVIVQRIILSIEAIMKSRAMVDFEIATDLARRGVTSGAFRH